MTGTPKPLAEWPDCSTEYWNKSSLECTQARSDYWEQRCRLAVAALRHVAATGNVHDRNPCAVCDALDRIGSLPPESDK
jgi:hypothetical protein